MNAKERTEHRTEISNDSRDDAVTYKFNKHGIIPQ